MTKEKLLSILGRLDFWTKESEKWQSAMDNFCKTIAPSSYSPIIEDSFSQAFIDGVCLVCPELKEDLEYYAYELPGMDTADGKIKGKTYNLKNKDEYVQFVLDRIK